MNAKFYIWVASYSITIAFSIILVTHLLKVHQTYQPDTSQLMDKISLESYLDAHWQKNQTPKNQIPQYIPTGVYVNTIRWLDPQSFFISGYVWQKYPHQENDITHDFVLPEAIELKKTITYQWKGKDFDTIGWSFEGKIIQRFDYAKYPFDHKTVRIRLWHQDFDQRALLIPDLESYDSTTPTDKFGLDPLIVLGGYEILETYFRYQHANYDSNFGSPRAHSQKSFPELYYNIVLKRDAIDAIIIHILPLLLVLLLCFFSLLSSTFDENKRELYQFRYMPMLTECAALFFVVLLAHIHMREVFAGVGGVYLEFLYGLGYLSIAYVTFNTFLVVHAELTNYKIYNLIKYGDNLVPKALFLPLFSGLVLGISLIFF